MSFKELRLEFPKSLEASASSMFKASTFAPVSKATFHTFSVPTESVRIASLKLLEMIDPKIPKRNKKDVSLGHCKHESAALRLT